MKNPPLKKLNTITQYNLEQLKELSKKNSAQKVKVKNANSTENPKIIEKKKSVHLHIKDSTHEITEFRNFAKQESNLLNKCVNMSTRNNEKIILHIKNIDNSFENKKICKICLDCEQNESNKLISPCLCQGSVKYIHELCLKNWILNNPKKNIKESCCEICNFKYTITFTTKLQFNRQNWCKYIEKLLTIIVASLVILSSVGYILYLIISRYF